MIVPLFLASFSAVFARTVPNLELDLSHAGTSSVHFTVYELPFDEKNPTKTAKLFLSMYEDGFERVKDGEKPIWTREKGTKSLYVKVFFEGNEKKAIKVGLRPWNIPLFDTDFDTSEFFLGDESGWKRVGAKEYFGFLRRNNFTNFVNKDMEPDEKVENGLEIGIEPTEDEIKEREEFMTPHKEEAKDEDSNLRINAPKEDEKNKVKSSFLTASVVPLLLLFITISA